MPLQTLELHATNNLIIIPSWTCLLLRIILYTQKLKYLPLGCVCTFNRKQQSPTGHGNPAPEYKMGTSVCHWISSEPLNISLGFPINKNNHEHFRVLAKRRSHLLFLLVLESHRFLFCFLNMRNHFYPHLIPDLGKFMYSNFTATTSAPKMSGFCRTLIVQYFHPAGCAEASIHNRIKPFW